MRYFLFLTSLFLWLAAPCNAIRSLDFEWINDRNGLSQNTVRCILQDNTGFIWFGTINGLNRYNGREFVVMHSQSGVQESITDNRIRSLTEDKNGYIWVRTVANTYSCYDPNIERFVDYNPEDSQKRFSQILITAGGDVWLWGKSGGACRIRHKQGSLQTDYFSGQTLGTAQVNFVYEDLRHQVWLGTNLGVYIIENNAPVKISDEPYNAVEEFGGQMYLVSNSKIAVFDPEKRAQIAGYIFADDALYNMSAMLNSGVILIALRNDMLAFDCRSNSFIPAKTLFGGEKIINATFYTDNRHNIWVYNMSGALWMPQDDGAFKKLELIPPHILANIDAERYEIFHDSRGIIWITTYGNGLFALEKSGAISHYTMSGGSLPSNHLLCVMEDKSGEMWVGTEFAGVGRISVNDYPVQMLYPSDDEIYNRNNAVRLIFEDSGRRFWIGTRGGFLHLYDSLLRPIGSQRIAGGLPFCMVEDSTGRLWLGTRGNGIILFPPSGDKLEQTFRLREHPQYTGSNSIFDMIIDNRNRLWAATFGGGLHCADIHDAKPVFRQINMRTQSQDQTRVILQDSKGIIWTGTNEGVNAFHPDSLLKDNSKYINFHYEADSDSSLNNNEIKAIYEDSRGRLWFGTTGGGLNLLVREEPLENSRFRHFTSAQGLSNEVIQAILEDGDGNLWVSTEGGSGIARFNPGIERFENFRFTGSRSGGQYNEGSRWKRKNGELMFGSYSGVCIFDPAKMQNHTCAPNVVITGFKISPKGRDVARRVPTNDGKSITRTDSLTLRHDQNSFDIEFAMLNYHAPDYNQYSYFLDGYENAPNPATRRNIASYLNLPPGKYIFKVKGSNSFGVWTESHTELKITILPPFWKTLPAYLAYILLTLAVGIIIRLILKKKRGQPSSETQPHEPPQPAADPEPDANRHPSEDDVKDKKFLDSINSIIERNLENTGFTVDDFAREMAMGRTKFFRRVKDITGHSPNEYIRVVRLKKAAEMLASSRYSVSEVAFRVGFDDPFYFSKCFKTQFGVSPTQYQ